MLGIPLAMVYSNVTEWVVHKYLLHGLGRDRRSVFSFHWHEHHRASRRNGMYDAAYAEPQPGRTKWPLEELGVLGYALAHAPLFSVAPFFTATVWVNTARYYAVHRRAHLDPEWARAHLPWHYDHHMGPDQDANWCITSPWFDELVGTRQRYAHTEREREDRARVAKKGPR